MYFDTVSFILIVFIHLTDAETICSPEIPESQVARMCNDSSASGTSVYIDTTRSESTNNITGPVCDCVVTIYNAKFVTLNVNGTDHVCSAALTVRVNSSGSVYQTDEDCRGYGRTDLKVSKLDNIKVSLQNTKLPNKANYCTKLQLDLCGMFEYQCNDGKCINKKYVCDNNPNCDDGDDEGVELCKHGLCGESRFSCGDKNGCFDRTQICDAHNDCIDGTDEQGCNTYWQTTTTTVGPRTEAPLTKPWMKVSCLARGKLMTLTPSTMTTTTTTTTPSSTTLATYSTTTTQTVKSTTKTTPPQSSTFKVTTRTTTNKTHATSSQVMTTTKTTTTDRVSKSSRPSTSKSTRKHTNNKNKGHKEEAMNTGLIIAIVLIVLAFIVACVCLAIFLRRKIIEKTVRQPDLWMSSYQTVDG